MPRLCAIPQDWVSAVASTSVGDVPWPSSDVFVITGQYGSFPLCRIASSQSSRAAAILEQAPGTHYTATHAASFQARQLPSHPCHVHTSAKYSQENEWMVNLSQTHWEEKKGIGQRTHRPE